MLKTKIIYILIGFFIASSFVKSSEPAEIYELELNAGGCHYQISVNNKILIEGKSYQSIQKKIKLDDNLQPEGEQLIDAHLMRISREMPLKISKGFINLKLNKITKDSTILVKELKLPTFPYDEDEQQPESISGSIEFKIAKKLQEENPVKK